jgi:hypothetical protein
MSSQGVMSSEEASNNPGLCSINPLTPNDLQRRHAVSPLKIKIPSKNLFEKSTNTPIIHSVHELCMVAATCFDITLPSSRSIPSAFWEMFN